VSPLIVVSYAHSPWVARYRSVRFFIDGANRGSVKNGDSAQFAVPEGEHQVQARMDWCHSKPHQISVTEGSPTEVTVSTSNNPLSAMFKIVFRPSRFVVLESMG
jgi:hypothetical protein